MSKICPKCGQSPEDFGSQRLCRPCWRVYNEARIRARTQAQQRRIIPKNIVDRIRQLRYFIKAVPVLRVECETELRRLTKCYDIGLIDMKCPRGCGAEVASIASRQVIFACGTVVHSDEAGRVGRVGAECKRKVPKRKCLG